MKVLKRLVIDFLMVFLLLVSCSQTSQSKVLRDLQISEEKETLGKMQDMMGSYFETQDSAYLDSILYDLDSFIAVHGLSVRIVLNKLRILGELGRFKEGIDFLKSFPESFPRSFGNYYKQVIELRFMAMYYQQTGDSLMRDQAVNNILDLLRENMKEEEDNIKVFLNTSSESELLSGPYFVILCQYFSYLSIKEGKTDAEAEMKKYFNSYTNLEPLTSFISDIMEEELHLDGNNLM